jgi:diguanylate cyclase (GGDEF)-like protein
MTVVLFVVWRLGLGDPAQATTFGFSYRDQLGRILLLIMATLVSTTLVVRVRELRRKSTRDSLTSLANRGFFDDSLVQLEAIASRSADSIGVAMIDVDHFKRFNDTHGHLAGDVALQRVAETLADSFRNTDLIARYGGEEFAGLFPGMKHADAHRRLDQMRRRIESLPIQVGAGGQAANVTVSMGLAVFPGDGVTLNDTLAIADERLYEAKQRGRNQVVGGDESSPDGIG